MKQEKKMKRRAGPILRAYILCFLVLVFAGFLVMDMFFPALWQASGKMKYSGMLLVMALAVSEVSEKRSRDGLIVLAALSFTLAADFLLLFTEFYSAGIAVFCGAHLCYILRYRKNFFIPMLCVAAAAGLVAVTFWYQGFSFFYVIAGLYGLLLLTAVVCAWYSNLPRVNKLLACVGMLCFLLCDLNVAFYNLSPAYQVRRYAGLLIWIFYLPAQMLIALSIGNYPTGRES